MATTSIGAPGVVFPDGTTQTSATSGVPVINVYSSSGTWTKPASVKAIKVTVVGGGGNGGSATRGPSVPVMGINPSTSRAGAYAGGGGGGGSSTKVYPAASLPGPQPYTVGTAGNSSSFGGTAPVITATGGTNNPGTTGSTPSIGYGAGSAGGAGSGGDINTTGSYGSPTFTWGGGEVGGTGGSSILAGSSREQTTINSAGYAGNPYGGGGGGGIVGNGSGPTPLSVPGGAGGTGVVIVEEFY